MIGYVRVFAHSNSLLVSHVRNLLAAAGIPVELRNMVLAGGAGELPLGECEPEVWVAEHNRERAESLIRDAMAGSTEQTEWRCSNCGETLDGVFEACWRCGTPKA
ncbi:putative signal transducing protein [Billgrantia antri]|uniref:putative signal transducing protein n=1 Tax=Billgrantia antri TaxID=2846777 RepID=UPI003B20BE57